jgi:tripeptidyl-peptidase-1
MATDQFGSGAGFYPMFMTDHEFQDAAVAKYLSTVDPSTLPPADSYDPKARATPDVSALGEGFQVIVDGRPMSVGGTSASSPTFAGLMSLLNEARQTAGKANMGFLNPFLYKNEAAFFDVTVGSCKIGRGGQMLPYGFNASAGWDPATGLGTPHFDKLLAAAMAAVEDKAEM